MAKKSRAKRKVLVIDNYKSANSNAVQQIVSSIKGAGYDADVVTYDKAKAAIADGKDILEGYHGAVSSGSGKRWSKETDKDGNVYMVKEDPVHKHLAGHEKPLYAICAGYYGLAQALGYRIKDTGKQHTKTLGGHKFNHKYGLDAEDIDSRLKNVETFEHAGKSYVKSFDYGNKRGVQYHAERTEAGRKEIADFLNKYVKAA